MKVFLSILGLGPITRSYDTIGFDLSDDGVEESGYCEVCGCPVGVYSDDPNFLNPITGEQAQCNCDLECSD